MQVTSTSISPSTLAVALLRLEIIRRKASGSFIGTIKGHLAPAQDTLTAATVGVSFERVIAQAERAALKKASNALQARAGFEIAPREGSDEKKLKLISGPGGVHVLRDCGGSVRLDERELNPAGVKEVAW